MVKLNQKENGKTSNFPNFLINFFPESFLSLNKRSCVEFVILFYHIFEIFLNSISTSNYQFFDKNSEKIFKNVFPKN